MIIKKMDTLFFLIQRNVKNKITVGVSFLQEKSTRAKNATYDHGLIVAGHNLGKE